MVEDSELSKDMGVDFVEKLSRILSEIYETRNNLIFAENDGHKVLLTLRLNNLIQSWFMKIYGKIKKMLEDKDIKKQTDLEEQLTKKEFFHYGRAKYSCDPPILFLNDGDYFEYHRLLNERELHLNDCMEKMGLTIPEKKSGRKY